MGLFTVVFFRALCRQQALPFPVCSKVTEDTQGNEGEHATSCKESAKDELKREP